ncbi:MAG: HAD-IIIA family hydrolase [Crocinitomicaceae bacterium]|jgi:histidinol-phosphate phosphatase family protein|nr:HAD-IIIA family hydrolase [Crocinitomicaceae bacterium]MDP4761946.1 HAD-IIIA family hydrolase [Crocinitomicaceae bacterium]
MQKFAQVDETWTLFLDRDGVINERIFGGYILDYSDFHFKEAVLEQACTLFAKFARVIVVTNQQCVAKGLISIKELEELHQQMKEDFERSGAKIAAVFAAIERKGEEPFMRKPHRKMADLAKEQFPEIDFSKSIMVGDTDGDIEFGKNLGMKTVLIESEEKTSTKPDLVLTRLVDLIEWI